MCDVCELELPKQVCLGLRKSVNNLDDWPEGSMR